MTRPSYAEACIEYVEAVIEFKAWEQSPRAVVLHSHFCDCRDCLPRRVRGDRAGVALNRAWRRAMALRPAPEAPTEADKADVRGDEKMEARKA